MTDVQREEQRRIHNEANIQRRAEVTVQELESQNRDEANVVRNSHQQTFEQLSHYEREEMNTLNIQSSLSYNNPTNGNIELNLENKNSRSIEHVPAKHQNATEDEMNLSIEGNYKIHMDKFNFERFFVNVVVTVLMGMIFF